MWQRQPSLSHSEVAALAKGAAAGGAGGAATTASRRRIISRAVTRGPLGSLLAIFLAIPCLVFVGVLYWGVGDDKDVSRNLQDQRGPSAFTLSNLFFWSLKQTAQEAAKQEAVIVGIPNSAVDRVFAPIEPLTVALGITNDVEYFNAAWQGFWLRNAGTCLADNTARLIEAVQSPQCDVVLLMPGKLYKLDDQMIVTEDTIIMGNPADRPIIDAAEAERAFLVRGMAMLEVRHILFYEGDGDLIRDEFRTRWGGVIYLERGCTLFAFDCLFTIQPSREPIINDSQEFIFGGDILMEGGVLTVVACSFFAIVPGFVNTISTEIGGSVLILGGTATFTLVNFMTSQIFAFNIGTGMHLSLLGGTVVMTGCTHTANLLFAGQGLCGRNIFIGGGVGIFTGIAVTDTMGFLAFYGAGLSIFIGGGLGVFTGCEITLSNAISMKAGVGVGVAIGAGMGLFYGVPFAKNLGITQFNTLGVFVFVGAGRMAFIGCPFAHQNAIAAWELLGGAIYLGAGQAVLVGCAFARSLGIDFFVGLGGDIFLGAGQLVYVGSAMTSNTGITAFIGQGTELFVAAGSAFIKNVSFSVNIGVHFYRRPTVGFYVAGRECEVKTSEEAPEGVTWLKEKGYAFCEKKGEEGEGEGEGEGDDRRLQNSSSSTSTATVNVVVQGLRGKQRLGGWHDLTPLDTSPASMYVGKDLTSCSLCGLDGVVLTGPGTTEEVCPNMENAVGACPAPASSVSAVPAGVMGAGLINALSGDATTKTTTLSLNTLTSTATVASTSSTSKNKLFGLGRRLRELIEDKGGDGGDDGDGGESGNRRRAGRPHQRQQQQQQHQRRQQQEQEEQPQYEAYYNAENPLPDTYVVIADIVLNCADGGKAGQQQGCNSSAAVVQDLLEDIWLQGLEDEARLLVSPFKSIDSLKETLGIPSSEDSSSSYNSRRKTSSSSSPGCAQQEAFAAYAHTTDKATYQALLKRLPARSNDTSSSKSKSSSSSSSSSSGNTTLEKVSLALTDVYGGAFCSLTLTLRDDLFVPAPAMDASSGGSSTTANLMGNADFTTTQRFVMPRVWVNITDPLVAVGSSYEVAISHFDQGDRVALHLLSNPSAETAKEHSLFFSSAPRLFYTFKAFDALQGNQTWQWRVSALTFKGMNSGPYFLKAFDVMEPGRFVLSQAFNVQDGSKTSSASGGAGEKAGSTTLASRILRRLSSGEQGQEEDAHLEEEEEHGEDGGAGASSRSSSSRRRRDRRKAATTTTPSPTTKSTTKSNNTNTTTKEIDDTTMMSSLLSMQKDHASMGDMWKALNTLPSAQKALKNSTLARQLLERAPVLKHAPEIQALDAKDGAGWKDPLKVQAAFGAAISNFIDLSLSVMKTGSSNNNRGPSSSSTTTTLTTTINKSINKGDSSKKDETWPTKILASLTPEEEALAGRVAQEGDLDALGSLMNSQASQRFGGVTIESLKAMGLVEEFKTLFGATEVFRQLVDDEDLWQTLAL